MKTSPRGSQSDNGTGLNAVKAASFRCRSAICLWGEQLTRYAGGFDFVLLGLITLIFQAHKEFQRVIHQGLFAVEGTMVHLIV